MTRDRPPQHPRADSPRLPRQKHEENPAKLTELAGCPDCGASYRNGRWTWQSPPSDSYEFRCPACERVKSNYPAGILDVEGDFALSRRAEILSLLRNVEESQRLEHPLKRIMGVEDREAGFSVTVTDANLARAFGKALKHAYAGELKHPPTTGDKENLVRVHWSRS